ncbi:DUF4976 domain-containing protein [Puteibacter caeruleilacunae]|nr:DUF4976 domain-containing protein [Puteibacter caeruleilacunae]
MKINKKNYRTMDRRTFIKNTSAAGALTAMPGISIFGNNAESSEQPNILFIMTDQQMATAMSHRGNKWLKTPNMDRLAEKGTTFTKAYCPQPLCGPCRSSMLTGKYPHEMKATVNLPEKDGYWGRDVKVMGKIMKKAGYDTGYVGKWHLPIPVSDIDLHGFDFITNTKRRDWQDASIPADCGDFLKKKRKQPFFLVASFINPHDICEFARGQKLRMDEIETPPPYDQCPPLPDNLEIPEGEPSFVREMHLKSPKQYPTVGWKDEKWRHYSWAYYRLVEKVDHYVGLVLESLERNGYLDNTIIVFTSDHGDGNGSHRLNQKQILYEEATNVPFIISHLTKGKARVNDTSLVNTGLDLIPTFCDYAGGKQPSELKGMSAQYGVKGTSLNERKYLFMETEFAENAKSFGITGRAVRGDRYKYIVYSKGDNREQLFDLYNDPGEMNDLSDNPDYAEKKAELIVALKQWQNETNDQVNI